MFEKEGSLPVRFMKWVRETKFSDHAVTVSGGIIGAGAIPMCELSLYETKLLLCTGNAPAEILLTLQL